MSLPQIFVIAATGLLLSGASLAQDIAPTPKKAPRTPVTQQNLLNSKNPMPATRTLSGALQVIDTEQLRINDYDMRLFGIVPPQLSASYGPQARAVLDNLTAGVVTTCTIRDRDRTGRLLANCYGKNNADLALELLRRGLAITARGSLQSTDLAPSYLAAEQASQNQKLGLWSMAPPPAAKVEAPAAVEPAKAKEPAVAVETPPQPAPVETVKPKIEPVVTVAPKPALIEPANVAIADTIAAASALATADAVMSAEPQATVADEDFLAKYQLLISAILMLLTAGGIAMALWYHRWSERRDEIRATAAALRGELLAARALVHSRIKPQADEADERATTWPRIRTIVFQAYVDRLGLMGAELARQIASIYGLASDYSAYYATPPEHLKHQPLGKQQALQTLLHHIDEVLPRLERIEITGQRISQPQFISPMMQKFLPEPPRPPKSAPVPPILSSSQTPPAILEKPTATGVTSKSSRHVARVAPNDYQPIPPVDAVTAESIADDASTAATIQPPTHQTTEPADAMNAKWQQAKEKTAAPTASHRLRRILQSLRTPTQISARDSHLADDDHVPDYTALSQDEMDILAFNNLMDDTDILADRTEPPPAAKRKTV